MRDVIEKYSAKEISIELTNECLLRCKHCSSEAGNRWDNELSLDEIKKIIDTGRKIGTNVISLSGGEPLLRPDILEIMAYVKEKGYNILLYTSGVLRNAINECCGISKELCKELEKYICDDGDKIIFSLEGVEKVTHEFITGVSGSYDLVFDGISQCLGMPFIELHITPMSVNYKSIPILIDFVEQYGVNRVSILRLVPQGRCFESRYLMMNRKEFFELQRIQAALYKKYDEGEYSEYIDVRFGDPVNFMFWVDESIPNQFCGAGRDRILIRANGECQFCAALKHSPEYDYGNIRKDDLEWLWKESPMVKRLREFHDIGWRALEGLCSKCKFLDLCRGGCLSQRIHKYKDMQIGPDPLCPILLSESERGRELVKQV